jgi:hypothetical protein
MVLAEVSCLDTRLAAGTVQPTRHFWQCTSSTGSPSISFATQSTSFSPP